MLKCIKMFYIKLNSIKENNLNDCLLLQSYLQFCTLNFKILIQSIDKVNEGKVLAYQTSFGPH